ncbi:hypothetical protein AGMMS50225_10560 [Betaproteobacteria bacterium]|nr:hypothetical protein AGMMS50225_10560 [Betaproteobacteria bacterium]
MHIETVRRVALARHLFELAEGSLRSKNDLHLFSAVNLAQDAVESFLIALADNFAVTFDQNTKFDKYFVLINAKIAPRELPFKAAMLRLNRIRIDSKHHGIQPARDECERLLASAREFLDEASLANLGAPFSTLSAIELLDDGECKQLLITASAALEGADWDACLVACRQALYVEIERHYDISAYKDEEPRGLLAGFTRAPYYAQSMKYVAENVCEPTDYIVLDHAGVDRELLISGVDPTDFWNVWRLTPEVFRNKAGKWYIKRDFSKLQGPDLNEVAGYAFNKTLDVVLARQTNRRSTRWRQSGRFYLNLAKAGASLYPKADRSTKPIAALPESLTRVDTDYSVDGLQDDGLYWHVSHFEAEQYYYGFIHGDDVRSEG